MDQQHKHYMQRALILADQATHHTSPNPKVGCVIVKNHQTIGEGWHEGSGTDHAEVMALQNAGSNSTDATVYLTLEPCYHTGHTPPCVRSLIKAQIRQVFIADIDPNPKVSGQSIVALRNAGIDVNVGLLQKEAQLLNPFFYHFMKNSRPYIICKWAMSLDGYSVTKRGDSKQISSVESQEKTQQLRQQVDAILIGCKTALLDNPKLTTRLTLANKIPHHPIRLVLDSKGNLPLSLNLFSGKLPGRTVVVTTNQSSDAWRKLLEKQGIEVWVLEENQQQISLQHLMSKLYQQQILSVLVEGGRTIHNAFFKANLVDEVQAYIAPVIIGDLPKKKILSGIKGDFHVHGYC